MYKCISFWKGKQYDNLYNNNVYYYYMDMYLYKYKNKGYFTVPHNK